MLSDVAHAIVVTSYMDMLSDVAHAIVVTSYMDKGLSTQAHVRHSTSKTCVLSMLHHITYPYMTSEQ
jgi:hypothetical protein